MTEEWLIDGYNLLHDQRSRTRGSHPPTPQDLCKVLADFASTGDRRVVFVLDGKGNEQEYEGWRTAAFRVVFSGKVTADTYIEKYLFDHRGPNVSFLVVTRDRSIGDMAAGNGARVVRPDDFMERVKAGKKDIDEKLFKDKTKSHGFNRPFDKKLDDKGFA